MMEAKAIDSASAKIDRTPAKAALLSLSLFASCDAQSTPMMDPFYLDFSEWLCSGGQTVGHTTGAILHFPSTVNSS